jgi:hypothetical protein
MAFGTRELYRSPNGDRWHLVRETDSGSVFVMHQANASSGGYTARLGISEFLADGQGPEHQALLDLIGSLVGQPAVLQAAEQGEPAPRAPPRRR